MATAQLTATPRDKAGKGVARKLRQDGRVPAVIYGSAREPQPLSVSTRELERLLQHFAAGNTVIELALDGKTSRTLIREIQRHPVKRRILHVDFQELVAGERVTVNVPVVLTGVPEGVRLGGGMLDQVLYELEVEADPSDIPAQIDVDVVGLQVGQSVHVRDIVLAGGVVATADGALAVCTVQAPRVAEVTEEEAAGAEPVVIRKVKEDETEK